MATKMIDVCSLNFTNNNWESTSCTLSSSEETQFHDVELEDVTGYSGRFTGRLQFGFCQDSCRIIITPREAKHGVGCRMIGTIIEQLSKRLGGVKQLPTKLYLEAGQVEEAQQEYFRMRSLLTLSCFCTAKRRGSIHDSYSTSSIPALPNEKASEYEKRVVESMGRDLGSEYRRLPNKDLNRTLKKVQGKPDGLFLDEKKSELVIIEVKKNKRDFDEGAAQIVQYYAQALNLDGFRNCTIQTRLITASDEERFGYKVWKDLMRSEKEIKILVHPANVKGVSIKEPKS